MYPYLRPFNAEEYVNNKVAKIIEFAKEENVKGFTLGLSGGVDSAVVFALLQKAALKSNDQCYYFGIDALILPIKSPGVSGQKKATKKAEKFYNEFSKDYVSSSKVIDLTKASNAYSKAVNLFQTNWSRGQLDSALRIPALVFYNSIASQINNGTCLIAGTTNKSEGYIGFYGKYSDGCNDLQVIADLYKSEVYKVAEYLKIPEYITKDAPTGDIYTGQTTEELMGFSYDFLELYAQTENLDPLIKEDLFNSLFPEYSKYEEQILKVIKQNYHKTKVGVPSRFINIDGSDKFQIYKGSNI